MVDHQQNRMQFVLRSCNFARISLRKSRTSYNMNRYYQLYLPTILLMRAGDIETNPGPVSPESHIEEQEIVQLLKEIRPAYYHSLGTSLGIKMEQYDDDHDAFRSVLMDWNTSQQHPDINRKEILADTLRRIGLWDLSDRLQGGSLVHTAPYATTDATESPVEPMSPELIERCRKDFMLKYKTTLCRIRSDPLNPDSLVQLQETYTNLVLEDECGKRNLDYNDLLKLEKNGSKPKRFLIQGEAGAGKTTLCAKIAWDWINGTHYQQIAWLLIVPLRESEDYTMGEIAKSYLQEDNPTTAAQLTHYIRSNPDNVLTVYDGLDEFKGKLQKKGRNEKKGDVFTKKTRKHRPTLHAGDDERQVCSQPSGSHSQESIVYTHADGLNKELGTQQTHENTEMEGNERPELGGVIQHPDSFTKDASGEFSQRTDDCTKQADGSSKQPDGYSEGKSVYSHEEVGFSDLPGPSTAYSGIHTRNPSGYTQHYDSKYNNCELVIGDIICCDQLKTSVVLITTRPWKAREISEDTDIRDGYAFIRVDGFREEDASSYIHKYFAKDESRANDLIEFIKNSDVVSENMARYPIFLAMLCLMWKEIRVEKKQTLRCLQTYSQFFGEMFMFLKEHYVQKIIDDLSPSSLDRVINETSVLLKPIAELAFTGLLENTFVFDERYFQDFQDSKTAACRVGVLSRENRIAPGAGREERKPHVQSTVFFPHKLFQEYMAGVHLASLHDSDHKGYTKLMKEVVLPRKEDFRYLLYFTASQNKTVGISVMTHMVQGCKKRTDFLVDVAFECNDPDPVAVVQHYTTPKVVTLKIDDRNTSHTIAGYASVGVDMVDLRIKKSCGKTASRDVGRIICSSPSLIALTIPSQMHDDLYSLLAEESPNIKVQTLEVVGIECPTPASSHHLAEALCSLPNLTNLKLDAKHLSDEFYSTLKAKASFLQVHTLKVVGVECPTSASSHHLAEALCSMPKLCNLKLDAKHLSDEFYSTLKARSSSLQVHTLKVVGVDCPTSASSHDLAEALCSMPNMTDLTLDAKHLSDEFCSTLKARSSSLEVETLKVVGVKCRTPASSHTVAEALCSMPNLTDLKLEAKHFIDEFCSILKVIISPPLEGCFPQISKGNFRFNGSSVENLESFVLMLSEYQGEEEFGKLSEPTSPSHYTQVGEVLQIPDAELRDATNQSVDTSTAFMKMLKKWRDSQTPGANIWDILAGKLAEYEAVHSISLISSITAKAQDEECDAWLPFQPEVKLDGILLKDLTLQYKDGANSVESAFHEEKARKHNDCYLGGGSFGEVFKAKHPHHGEVAVKVAKLGKEDRVVMYKKEAEKHGRALRCRHIVAIKGFIQCDDGACHCGLIGIVMEFMQCGSLWDFRTNKWKDCPDRWPLTNRMVYHISSGMSFLHDDTIIHRDLKLENVLLDADLNAKIADLGLATNLRTSSGDKCWGTASHKPPEAFRTDLPSSAKVVCTKYDVYSFAMTLYELLTGTHPYEDRGFDVMKLLKVDVKQPPNLELVPPSTPEDLKQIMIDSWSYKPEHRPEFKDIKERVKKLGIKPRAELLEQFLEESKSAKKGGNSPPLV